MKNNTISSVQDYIQTFPEETQEVLNQMRQLIFSIVIEVVESISYAMPAYKINGKPLVYFAGYKNHIGFYALPASHKAFEKQLSKYKHGKGSVQFPLDKPVPVSLITKMVQHRLKDIALK